MNSRREELVAYIIDLFIKGTYRSIPNRGIFHTFISQLTARNYMLYRYSSSLGYRILIDYNNQALKFTLPNHCSVREKEPIKDWDEFSKQHGLFTDIQHIREFKDKLIWKYLVNPKLPWNQEFIIEFETYLFEPYCLISGIAEIPWSEELLDRYKDRLKWIHLSLNEGIPWSEEIIIKYAELWNWKHLSLNKSVLWTPKLLELFKGRIDWYYLSSHLNTYWTESLMESLSKYISWEQFCKNPHFPWDIMIIKKVKNELHWCWDQLSDNKSFPTDIDLIESFSDKWTWWKLCRNRSIKWDANLIEKFYDRINWSSLSENPSLHVNYETIAKYKEEWNWDRLCGNEAILIESKFLNDFEEYIEFKGRIWVIYPSRDDWYAAPGILLNGNIKLTVNEIAYFSKKFKWTKGFFYNSPDQPYEWAAFSNNKNLTQEILTEFSSYLDWKTISRNEFIPWDFDLAFKYKDLFDWNLLLNNKSFWGKIIEPLPELFDIRTIHKVFADIYKLQPSNN